MHHITQPGWALFHKDGRPASANTVVVDFRGAPATLLDGIPPRHTGSTGRAIVKAGKGELAYFPSVFNLEWRRA